MIWTIAETAILLILWILRRTVPGIPAAIPVRTAAGTPGRIRRRIAAGIKHTTAAGTIWITAAETSRLQQEKGRLPCEDGLFSRIVQPQPVCIRYSKKDGQADAYVGSDKRSTAG